MKRRKFIKASGLSLSGASLLAGCSYRSSLGGLTETESNSLAGSYRKGSRMHIGCQTSSFIGQNQFRERYGVKHISGYPYPRGTPFEKWSVDGLLRYKEEVASYGITLEMILLPMKGIGSGWNIFPNIMRAKDPERDRELDQLCELIAMTAKAGIPSFRYGLGMGGAPRTNPEEGRGGTKYYAFNRSKLKGSDLLGEQGLIDEDEAWERVTYFLERVAPVAAEYKVRMACHPNDPPIRGSYKGVYQVLNSPETMKRFVEIAENDYHGLNFCLGTIACMLINPNEEIHDVIRYFGERNKIFNIHFRNIQGNRDNFVETHHDNGDLDMFRMLQTLVEVDYPYMVMPDHIPMPPEGETRHEGFAYAYGYIKGLLQGIQSS